MPIPLIAEIVPKNSGAFALLDDANIRGGFRIVNNLTERNAIPPDKRKARMPVCVISTDTIYRLNTDLLTWSVDAAFTSNLQSAYNNGATIITTFNNPVILQGSDNTSRVFQITGLLEDILTANANGLVEFKEILKGKEYTTNIECVTATNSQNIAIDLTDILKYRAVQYFYTASNSDSSGYETGQIHIVHDGVTVCICVMMNSSIGVSCGISFHADIYNGNMRLLVTTDNSGIFSRVLRLFKVALP